MSGTDAKASNAMVPANIIRLIREKGLKHCTVAEQAGFTAQQLSDMLNGRKIIKVSFFILSIRLTI